MAIPESITWAQIEEIQRAAARLRAEYNIAPLDTTEFHELLEDDAALIHEYGQLQTEPVGDGLMAIGLLSSLLEAGHSRETIARWILPGETVMDDAQLRKPGRVRLAELAGNPYHDTRGRFTTKGGGPAHGGMTRSTPHERKQLRDARVEELVNKWGEKMRPNIEKMTSWMNEFTPAEAEDRRRRLAEAVAKHPDTQTQHSVLVDGELKRGLYTDERSAKHRALIDDYMERVGWENIPDDHEAILSGGLGGAGKGTMLEAMKIDESRYVTVDPDGLKGLMAKHGLVPNPAKLGLGDFDPPIRPMELAGLIHEESSDLSKVIASMAIGRGKNVILDNTMGSNSIFNKVSDLKAKGYAVDGVFVDVSVDMSVESALARHMNGTVAGGLGGRFVDPALAKAQAPEDPKYRSANAERFDKIKSELKSAVVIDNEAYAQRPAMFSNSTWAAFSPEARAYVLRNLRSLSTAELLAHAQTI